MRYIWVFIFIFFSATTALEDYEAVYDEFGNKRLIYTPPKKRISTYECGDKTTYYVDGKEVGFTREWVWTGGKRVVYFYDEDGNRVR